MDSNQMAMDIDLPSLAAIPGAWGDVPDQPLWAKVDQIIRSTGQNTAFRETFVNDIWPRLRSEYEVMVEFFRDYCRERLRQMGIHCEVHGRAKVQESVKKSLQRREDHLWRNEQKRYSSLHDIFDDIHDLAGIRIVLTYPGDLNRAISFIKQGFQTIGRETIFGPNRDVGKFWKPWFGTYETRNYRVKLTGEDGALCRFSDVLFEIQLTTFSNDLYNKLAHPFLYKGSAGPLTRQEEIVIDMSRGISHLYGLCLVYFQGKGDSTSGQVVHDELRRLAEGLEGSTPIVASKPVVEPGEQIRCEELFEAFESPPEECRSIAGLKSGWTRNLMRFGSPNSFPIQRTKMSLRLAGN
ncbi:unnamed protein product [Parascedosporium putredinis]|uniref:RelA/SpoT domain-containing protein n=1 Tax=Parascedosporium putredinis TaxID=1442378 RepID=A0A9P1MCS0_9PEZI|nr:unnamed protein product [Parascedosporium putredinis]CAI8002147.1 unnamed protein product [Parascedosporium putredinis]